MQFRFFLAVVGGVVAASTLTSASCFATPATYAFSGELYEVQKFDQDSTEFGDFEVGQKFSGRFTLDPEAVAYSFAYVSSSTNYVNLFTALDLSIDLPNTTYNYSPYLSAIPRTARGVYTQVSETDFGNSIVFRQENQPVEDNGSWEPAGSIPESYWIDGLYPHGFFMHFAASTYDGYQYTDFFTGTGLDFDLEHLFHQTGSASFTLRYTDPNAPDWDEAEQLLAIVDGQITSLRRIDDIPEPGTLSLTMMGLGLAGLLRWRPRSPAGS